MKGHGEPMRSIQQCAKSRKRLLAEVITRDVKTTELLRPLTSADPGVDLEAGIAGDNLDLGVGLALYAAAVRRDDRNAS
jgi:hypothetical protein